MLELGEGLGLALCEHFLLMSLLWEFVSGQSVGFGLGELVSAGRDTEDFPGQSGAQVS